VTDTLQRAGVSQVTARQKQDLAAVIHLCGASAGLAYARQKFKVRARQRCGDHDLERYLEKVDAMTRAFARMPREL
jgi:predicted metalloendopeptidase